MDYKRIVFVSVGVKRGVCSQINHFPEDADFDHDGAEYVLRKIFYFITRPIIMIKNAVYFSIIPP